MNSQQTKRSLLGLLISLLIHGSILGALFWNWHTPHEAASDAPGEISTTISMEMIQGMRVEEPTPEPEPEPQQVEPEPEKHDIVDGGSGTNTDELNAYRAAIRREIERHKRYPARAKMMRKQGVVSVSFSVSSDGSLSGERVTNSSGDESLDNAALEAVRSARPVGPKPAGFASSVSVPISFTIQ